MLSIRDKQQYIYENFETFDEKKYIDVLFNKKFN